MRLLLADDHALFRSSLRSLLETRGMEVVDALYAEYGDGAPHGPGPAQSRILYEGNKYLRAEFPKLDYIERATIVK